MKTHMLKMHGINIDDRGGGGGGPGSGKSEKAGIPDRKTATSQGFSHKSFTPNAVRWAGLSKRWLVEAVPPHSWHASDADFPIRNA